MATFATGVEMESKGIFDPHTTRGSCHCPHAAIGPKDGMCVEMRHVRSAFDVAPRETTADRVHHFVFFKKGVEKVSTPYTHDGLCIVRCKHTTRWHRVLLGVL
jgi:hypothetical protein